MSTNPLKSAVIRNSKSCDASGNLGYECVFDVSREDRGWDLTNNGTLVGVDSGFLFLSLTSESPNISRSTVFAPVDANIYTEVVLRFKYTKNREDSSATVGKVQFVTSSDLVFNSDKEVEFEVFPDDVWHTYRINMAAVKEWVGSIVNLKIFFTTNGRKSDEVFCQYVSIQGTSFEFCSDSCYEDLDIVSVVSNFDIEDLNNTPQNYSISLSDDERTARIEYDPETTTNKVVNLSNTSASFLEGPAITRLISVPFLTGYMSLKFRVSSLQGIIQIQTDTSLDRPLIELTILPSGKLAYRSGLLTVEFATDHEVITDQWYNLFITFNGDSTTCSVTLNDIVLESNLSYVFSGEASRLVFINQGTVNGDFLLDDILLVQSELQSKFCPGIGLQGQVSSTTNTFDSLNIVKGVNDSIIININQFGDEVITLPETTAASPYDVRSMLEREISLLDIGGYVNCEVLFIDGIFTIKSGTYGFDSLVEVKAATSSSLAEDLSFVDSSGNSISIITTGRPHASGFSFSNSYKATSIELNKTLHSSDGAGVNIFQDPALPSVEIGSRLAGQVSRKNSLSGSNKTFIDFYHRGNTEGKVDTVFFHGILPSTVGVKVTGTLGRVSGNLFYANVEGIEDLNVFSGDVLVIDTPGYEGNGSYKIKSFLTRTGIYELEDVTSLPVADNLSFNIHNIPKVKQFRLKKDGSLFLVNESSIGIQNQAGLYTRSADTHLISVDWDIHRGDLIGIYNATLIYTGNDPNESPDALYIEHEGDLLGDNIVISDISGQGIKGIGLYGQNSILQNKAIYDIELRDASILEYIDIKGLVPVTDLEYNLTTAVDKGLSVNVQVSGNHTHSVLQNGNIVKVEHPNEYFNKFALTDGNRYASNGFLGTLQANDSSASYFYISGDGEFKDLEFPAFQVPLSITDYRNDPFNISFSWDVVKPVHKYKVYFKEYPNIDGFLLEYLRADQAVSDGTKPGYELIGEGNEVEFTNVSLDQLVLFKGNLTEEDSYFKHFEKKFVAFVDYFNIENGDDFLFLREHPYTVIEKEFNSVSCRGLNWECIHHESTKISEIEIFSKTSSESSLTDIIELYFSDQDGIFQRAEGIPLDLNSTRFKLGYPVKFLRLIVNPLQKIFIDSIISSSSEDNIRYITSDPCSVEKQVFLDPVKGDFSNTEEIAVINGTGKVADVEIFIDTEEVTDSILVKSSLNTLSQVLDPDIGPAGILVQDEDFNLRTSDNVSVNAEVFALKNLAEDRKYYVTDEVSSENDFFQNHINVSKWEKLFVNFPQGSPADNIGLKFDGFWIGPVDQLDGVAVDPITAELKAKWHVTGEFSSLIVSDYDARGAGAELGSAIGIKDEFGHFIKVEKRRHFYDGVAINNVDYADIIVTNESSVVESVRTFDLFNEPLFGNSDDGVEYSLLLGRSIDGSVDLLKISYVDVTNGSGRSEWDGADFYSIDLSQTTLSGELSIFIENFWVDNATDPRGVPDSEGSRARIKSFHFGGESDFVQNYNFLYDGVSTSDAQFDIDNVELHLGTNPVPLYVAVDLSKKYALGLLQNFSDDINRPLWSTLNAQFSNTETDDPDLVEWGNSTRLDSRWVLFSSPSLDASTSGVSYLDFLRIYPDITRKPSELLSNSEWVSLGNILTDGDKKTAISQLDHPIIVVRLENQFDMSDFKLLDRSNKEAPSQFGESFDGWYGVSEYSLSSSITDDPKLVEWGDWVQYTDSNKTSVPTKWLSFRNLNFESYGSLDTPRWASELIVSTRGVNVEAETTDLVDFTEYSNWFSADYRYDRDISKLLEDDFSLKDVLFGSSQATTSPEGDDTSRDLGQIQYVFEDTVSSVYLEGTTSNVWRAFGEVSTTIITESGIPYSGSEVLPITVSGNQEIETDVTYSGVEIDGLLVYIPSSSPGVPDTISIQSLNGSDPLDDGNWLTLYTVSGLALKEDIEVSDDEFSSSSYDTLFNGGEEYKFIFEDTKTLSGIRMVFSDITFSNPEGKTIEVNRFYAFTTSESAPGLVSISNDSNVKHNGSQSLKVEYGAGFNTEVRIKSGGNFNIVSDDKWSIQDFLSYYIQIEDINDEIDYENSFIKLGHDSEIYYSWSLSSLSGINTDALVNVDFRFLDAVYKGEKEFDYNYPSRGYFEPQVDFIEGPIGFFELEVKPKQETQAGFNIWLDDFSVKRENFSLKGKSSNTLYLNNSELLHYPISGFDMRRGFIELTLTPDWSSESTRTLEVAEIFTIFSIVNSNNDTFSCYYDARQGLAISASNLQDPRPRFLMGKFVNEVQYTPVKLSIAWDSSGETLDARSGSTVRLWVNDRLQGDITTKWTTTKSKDTQLFIGGKVYQSDVEINTLDNYPTTLPVKIVLPTSSITAGVEDLLISSKPTKMGYNSIDTLKDKIYLSTDGITFFNGSDVNQLPIKVDNVLPGQGVTVWVKTLLPIDSTTMSRVGKLKSRWKVSQ